MLFHSGHIVPPNDVVVMKANTDLLIIALANMENLQQVKIFGLKWDITQITHTDQIRGCEQIAPSTM